MAKVLNCSLEVRFVGWLFGFYGISTFVLDAALLNSQHYKVRIKSKVEQSREWCSGLSYTLVQ